MVKNRTNLVVIFLILTILVAILNLLPQNLNSWYTNFLDPIISVSTVSIAIVIWYFQQKNYWKESLPKRLNVHFKYKGQVVMSCYEAYLSGESDIRQWGLQTGGQMVKGRLDFYPYLKSVEPIIRKSNFEKQNDESIDIMLYEITFYLSNDEFPNYRDDDFPNHNKLKGWYLVWVDNNPDLNDENKKSYIEPRPPIPYSIDQVKLELDKS